MPTLYSSRKTWYNDIMSTYRDAYDKWVVNQTPENMAGVVAAFMPTINSEIQRYEGPKSLLRGQGKILTIKAIRTYNPMSGANLNSWVVTNLRQLARYGQRMRDVKVPELALRQAAEVNRVYNEMSSDLGRPPTDEELADEIGISVKKLRRVRSQAKTSIPSSSFDATESDESTAYDPGVSTSVNLPFATDAVYMSLDDRDKKIYDMRTGSHGSKEYSAGDIAKRFGISNAAVSQRADYIAKQIANIAGG